MSDATGRERKVPEHSPDTTLCLQALRALSFEGCFVECKVEDGACCNAAFRPIANLFDLIVHGFEPDSSCRWKTREKGVCHDEVHSRESLLGLLDRRVGVFT